MTSDSEKSESWTLRHPPSQEVEPQHHFTCSPEIRAAIRKDFPRVHNGFTFSEMLDEIKQQLAADGKTLDTAGPIGIVYPQPIKRQLRAEKMRDLAVSFRDYLVEVTGKKYTDFPLAEDIFQMHTRSGKIHSNYERQRFASAQAFAPNEARKYFILVDDILTTGTTMANMASYIESHGGKVVGAYSVMTKGRPWISSAPDWIKLEHGEDIASAAQRGFDGGDSALLTKIEEQEWANNAIALKTLGLNIFYLTDGEQSGLRYARLEEQAENAQPAGLTEAERQLLINKTPSLKSQHEIR